MFANCIIGCPFSLMRSMRPRAMVLLHRYGLPIVQKSHAPHEVTKATTTRSPGFTRVTALPTAATTPADS